VTTTTPGTEVATIDGTEVAVIDAVEGEVLAPLSEKEAKEVHQEVLAAFDTMQNGIDFYINKVFDAVERGVHTALGKSLREYLQSLPAPTISDKAERRWFIAMLTGRGLSMNMIEEFTGISKATQHRDLKAGVSSETLNGDRPQPPARPEKVIDKSGKQNQPAKKKSAEWKPDIGKKVIRAAGQLAGIAIDLDGISNVDDVTPEQRQQFKDAAMQFRKSSNRMVSMLNKPPRSQGESCTGTGLTNELERRHHSP
jgi:hypothetical protein